MAMAEVYRPESDDHLPAYPRAPPPSPEAQHKTVGGIFEFQQGVFDGFGIDLRRRDFDFSEYEEDDFPSPIHEPTTVQRSSPKRAASSDTDDSDFEQPGSPMKRMCSAPSTMPNSFEVQGFNPSLLASTSCTISSGNGNLLQPISTTDIKVSIPNFSKLAAFNSHSAEHVRPLSHSHSTSPTLFQHQNEGTTPYSIPQRSTGSVTPTHQPTTHPHDSSHLLSKSFDLHNVQSCFPSHFEVTPPPPEVRPTRSRTLDTSTCVHEKRTRKLSLKRNYGELESEPNLQFAFDYSYSSTGSSGESEWVVIDSDLSSYPQGKKACCQQEPLSSAAAAAMSKRHSNHLSANSGSPLHATNATASVIGGNNTTTTAVTNGTGVLSHENVLLRSQEVTASTPTHLGQSSSPLGVQSSNNGADLSSFPGGSAASNGSGSHSPLHTQLGMIHESIGLGSSSAELNNASSAGYMQTADAALAERSQRAEFVPQWSMEMMDCGDYSMRLDSIDSMDCGQSSDHAVTMQSLGGLADGEQPDLDDSLLFSNNYSQLVHHQQQQNHTRSIPHYTQQQGLLLNPGTQQPQIHHHLPGSVMRSQSSEASLRGLGGGETSTPSTRHSFIENYFISYHNNQSVMLGGGVIARGGEGHTEGTLCVEPGCEARSNQSKSL